MKKWKGKIWGLYCSSSEAKHKNTQKEGEENRDTTRGREDLFTKETLFFERRTTGNYPVILKAAKEGGN